MVPVAAGSRSWIEKGDLVRSCRFIQHVPLRLVAQYIQHKRSTAQRYLCDLRPNSAV